MEVREAIVLGEHDAVCAAARELARDVAEVCAEHERDVVAAELSGKLAPFPEQLVREPCRPAADELHEGPAVIAPWRRLLAEPLRLVPAARLWRTLRGDLANALRGGREVREPLAEALRRDVAHCEHTRR